MCYKILIGVGCVLAIIPHIIKLTYIRYNKVIIDINESPKLARSITKYICTTTNCNPLTLVVKGDNNISYNISNGKYFISYDLGKAIGKIINIDIEITDNNIILSTQEKSMYLRYFIGIINSTT